MGKKANIHYEVPIPEALLREGNGLSVQEQIILETGFHYICTGVDYPVEGGILVYYQGIPFPQKGLPDPGAVENVNIVKAEAMMLISMISKELLIMCAGFLFLPFKIKVKILSKLFTQFVRIAFRRFDKHFLKPERYCIFAREFSKFITSFLVKLGFAKDLSEHLARIVAMFMEYDMVYRYFLQDLFSSVTKEEMKNNPRKTILKMVSLIAARFYGQVGNEQDKDGYIATKFIKTGKLVSFILFHPRIKKAFLQALDEVDFTKLQMDAADKYFNLNNGNFEAFGMKLSDRLKIYSYFHKDGYPPFTEYKFQSNN